MNSHSRHVRSIWHTFGCVPQHVTFSRFEGFYEIRFGDLVFSGKATRQERAAVGSRQGRTRWLAWTSGPPHCGSESWTNRMIACEFHCGIGNRAVRKLDQRVRSRGLEDPLWLLLRQRYARVALLLPRKMVGLHARLDHPLAGQKVGPIT